MRKKCWKLTPGEYLGLLGRLGLLACWRENKANYYDIIYYDHKYLLTLLFITDIHLNSY